MKPWLTIREAMLIVHRSERTIYRWVEKGFVKARQTPSGVLVSTPDITKLESVVTRGRPKGTARPDMTPLA